VKLPYLYEEQAGGRTYHYVRRAKGDRIRINAEPGSAAFLTACTEALMALRAGGEQRESKYTWRRVVSGYYDSHEFRNLHQSTQRVRRRVIEQFLPLIAREDVRKFRPADVIKMIDAKANRGAPEAAKTRLNAIRAVLDFAERRDLVMVNVGRDAKVTRAARNLKGRPGGHTPWSREDIAKYFTRWALGTRQHLLMSILLYTGCRISDAVKLGPAHEKAGWLKWRETKGADHVEKKPTQVPILQPLRAAIDAAPHGDLVYMINQYGVPYSVKGLGYSFRNWASMTGVKKGLSAHGVRKASATMAANAGATENELMAMFGWLSPKQAAVYTRNVDRPRLASRAADLIADEMRTNDPKV
jgi:integrase